MRAITMTALSSIVVAAALVACAGSAGSEGTAGGPTVSGERLTAANACGTCHTGSMGTLAGGDVPKNNVYPPNLTPDVETGLGGWTPDQIATAITTGNDYQGMKLCSSMPRFSALSAQDLADLVAYLRSLPAVKHQVPNGACIGE